MKSRTELIHRALKNLGVLPQGETPSAQEYNSIDALVDPMIEDLIARDIIHIVDVDAIEEKHFVHLGHILAGHALSEFGSQNDPALTARAQKAETDLDEMDHLTVRYRHWRTMRSDYPVDRAGDVSTLFST
jgi:hypothetical protein